MQPIDERNLRQYLGAFADGELAPEHQLTVIQYLQAHPEARTELAQIQRLRAAAEQAVVRQTPPVPDALRQRISGLATPAAKEKPLAPNRVRSRFAWPAIAAMVTLACVLGFFLGEVVSRPTQESTARVEKRSTAPSAASDGLVTLAANMTHVHVDCSRFPLQHTSQIPRELGSLSDSLRRDLQSDHPYPDLTKMGYRYIGAGPCAAPLADTVHLLYVCEKPGAAETLSIFVQPADAHAQLEIGKLYTIAGPDAAHPALAWRTDQVVYFLVGDATSTIDRARALITGKKKLTRGTLRLDTQMLHLLADHLATVLFVEVPE